MINGKTNLVGLIGQPVSHSISPVIQNAAFREMGLNWCYLAMSCKHLRSDYNVAWPSAELAVMGAEGAVNIIHRREINEAADEIKEDVRSKLVDEYKRKFGDPYVAARNGWIDDVIEPQETRTRLIRALMVLKSKREWRPPRKHGNIPL